MKGIHTLLFLLAATRLFALETSAVEFTASAEATGVSIARDASGNLVFRDVYTSATTLFQLARQPVLHGALADLSSDDHPQYLNDARHDAAHDAGYNNALPISGDVGGNATLGAHVADGDIHLSRDGAETIIGQWTFGEARFDGGGIVLGNSATSTRPAITFPATTAGEFSYDAVVPRFLFDRTVRATRLETAGAVDGLGAAALENFATIAGIASEDLLASTAAESISAPWTFLAGVSSETITQQGLPAIRWRVVNGGINSIAVGDAVAWSGISGGLPVVEKITGEVSGATPFAGFATTAAASTAELDIVVFGIAPAASTGSVSAGQPVAWDGDSIGPIGSTYGYGQVGIALESLTGTGTVAVFVQRSQHPE